MSTVFIEDKAITLPIRFVSGQALDTHAAAFLQALWLKRMVTRLRWFIERNDVTEAEVQTKANELALMPLAPYGVADDDEDGENDPITQEAMALAREDISIRMAAANLPPPKGLDAHAKALIDAMPIYREKAKLRIEARYQAATAALGLS